ncbi:hypothetical protein D7X33_32055 [Butyricicoccus sp. 1XD8-22]|nr:hypothetical protein D7X33_32055 [Butyricicoccus sp. 1XD8-22]
MLYNAIFRTDKHEIHVERESEDSWVLYIYSIKHAVKELYEKHVEKSYKMAYLYIEDNYLESTGNVV